MDRELLSRRCEQVLLGLMLAVLVFSPLAFGAARLQEFLVVQLLTAVMVLVWLVRLWVEESPKLLLPPLSWAVLAFVGYAVFRYATCDVEYVGRQELLRVLVYAAVYFVAVTTLHRQESTQIISFTLFAVALVSSFYATYQFVTKSDLVWNVHSGYVGRGSGTYICPNHLAGFLEMMLPLAVAYVAVGRGKALTRILLAYAALSMVVGIAATASRGSWVAAGVALAGITGVLLWQRPFRWAGVALLGLLLLGGTVVVKKTDYFQKRIDKAFVGGKVDLLTRQVMWESALYMWRDHPWLGVGPGHYDLRWRQYRPASVQLQPERVHNDYLNTLTDWGAVGVALVVTALGLLGVGVVKVWSSVQRGERTFGSSQSDKFAFVLGASASLVALAIHSVVDFNLQVPANAIIAVTLMALLVSHSRFATERYWFSANLPGRLLITVLAAALIGYFGWQTFRLGREQVLLRQAAAELDIEKQTELFEGVYAVEPQNSDTAYAVGDGYRLQSTEGKAGYAEQAAKAIDWFQRSITNNPYNTDAYVRWGMMLDFLNRHDEAEKVFDRADELDPNGYFTCAAVGRHYVESGQYAAARPWLERSLRLWWKDNDIASKNLQLANERLLEAAEDPVLRELRAKMRELAQ